MPDFSRAGVLPPSATSGKMILTVGVSTVAMQIAVWAATGTWLQLTFAYVFEPVFSMAHLGSWLSFPQKFRSVHAGVMFFMGLPLGLSLALVGLFALWFSRRV